MSLLTSAATSFGSQRGHDGRCFVTSKVVKLLLVLAGIVLLSGQWTAAAVRYPPNPIDR